MQNFDNRSENYFQKCTFVRRDARVPSVYTTDDVGSQALVGGWHQRYNPNVSREDRLPKHVHLCSGTVNITSEYLDKKHVQQALQLQPIK